MKRTIKKHVALLILIAVFGCESYDFGTTGLDTNTPTEVIPASLLTGALTKLIGTVSLPKATLPASYIKHLSPTSYTFTSSYQTTNFNWEVTGNGSGVDGSVNFYNKVFSNLIQIIDLNTNEKSKKEAANYGANNNQIAVAKLLWAYYFQWATDRWGMLPYSEAFGGVEASKAKYDTQEEIYRDLFKKIEEALSQLNNEAGPIGDILFHGDMKKWAKFGNTLKMNMAIRLAKIYPNPNGYAATKFKEALPNTINSVAENIMFPTISDNTYDRPYKENYTDLCKTDNCLSEVLVKRMLELNDPRLAKFTAPETHIKIYVNPTSVIINEKETSKRNDFKLSETKGTPIFTYAQVSFNKAEATKIGWISGNTQFFYEEGIKASMMQWGVPITETKTYLKEPLVLYNETIAMNQIATQKWLALFCQPYEAWAEWRRLNYPILSETKNKTNNNATPLRQGYPITEPFQNKANYEAAIANQGADELHTKLWWDVN